MGYYINYDSNGNPLPQIRKAQALIADGGQSITPNEFQENLVCVVENGFFDAAGYCYCKEEFDEFNHHSDTRRKTWLIHPKAKELSGYKD